MITVFLLLVMILIALATKGAYAPYDDMSNPVNDMDIEEGSFEEELWAEEDNEKV